MNITHLAKGVFCYYNYNMYIKDFERELQQDISEHLTIKQTADDIAGIYFKDKYTGISTAPKYVFDNVNLEYRDNPPWWSGQKERVIYRSKPLLKRLLRAKIKFIIK
jgi:hypothetical protein